MTGNNKEKINNTPDAVKENNYGRYQELGGIINEKDYQSALDRARATTTIDEILVVQADLIAKRSGIILCDSKDALDPRTILYGILRRDKNPQAKHHHSDMSDQRLFAEALRMLGDTDSLDKLIKAHPNIEFS